MRCECCAQLRRQLDAVRDELAVWQGHARDEAEGAARAERVDRWRRKLEESPGVAKALIALVDAAPRAVGPLGLALAIDRKRDPDGLESPLDMARTMVCRTRRALKKHLAGFPILTFDGGFYAMTAADAAVVRQLMGDGQ